MILKLFAFSFIIFFSTFSFAAEKTIIRLAVLKFGTVNWELTTLKNQNIIDESDFKLNIHPVASPQAGKIALQSGAVDMIVSDWIWVSRLRSSGTDLTFYPYSTTHGALIVSDHSKVQSLKDLEGKKLGIAGGELDKNWLLLQTLAKQKYQLDLNNSVEKVFAAPPLLNQQLLHKRVDAVINYWHYAARLEAQGYQQLLNGKQILHELGIQEQVPTIGYVFNRRWANQNKKVVNAFLKSTQIAKNQLCQSDQVWQQIIPLTQAKDKKTEKKLRQRYCEGRIKQWSNKEQLAASKIYQLLRKSSDNKLTGNSDSLQSNTFWNID